MPNFRDDLTMTAYLPASPVLITLELLAGRVVSVPFNMSTVVEGTFCPTTASSPDAEVRGTLVAGLEKKSSKQNQQIEDKSTRLQSTSHLPVASSLGGAATLPRYRPSTLGMPSLGIRTWSRA